MSDDEVRGSLRLVGVLVAVIVASVLIFFTMSKISECRRDSGEWSWLPPGCYGYDD